MINIKSLLKSNEVKKGIAYTFFSFLNTGINFILLLFIAQYIPPKGYGTLNMIAVIVALFSMISTFGCLGYQNLVFFKSDFNKYRRIIIGIIILGSLFIVIGNIIIYICSELIYKITELQYKYQIIALFLCYSSIFSYLLQEYYRVREKVFMYGIISLSSVLLNTILTIYFVIICNSGWIGRLHAQIITAIILFILSIIILVKIISPNKKSIPSKTEIKEMLNWGIPLIPHQASFWIRQSLDRIFLKMFYSFSIVGLFSFAYNLANIIMMVGTAFNSINSVTIYKKLSNESETTKGEIASLYFKMIIIFALLTIGVIVGSYIMVPIVFPTYTNSLSFIVPLCISAFFQTIYSLFVNILFYYSKTKTIMKITITCSLIHMIISFIVIRFSSLFTAYMAVFTSILITTLIFYHSSKLYPLPWRKTINNFLK